MEEEKTAAALPVLETSFIKEARRASAHFVEAAVSQMTYRPMGVFFSEALAIIAACELVGATHFLESGTAEGQSTELFARYFGDRLNITTIDLDTAYRLYQKTTERLSRFPSVRCVKGNSFDEIPKLIAAMPSTARVVVFVDGPKGELGLKLVQQALGHPSVALVAFHDTAAVWSKELHNQMMGDSDGILMTSEGVYRRVFGALDVHHNEEEVIKLSYKEHHWQEWKIPHLLAKGNGLWLVGKSNLMSGPRFDRTVHVAMSSSATQLPGLLTCIASLLSSTVAPQDVTIHLFLPDRAVLEEVSSTLSCTTADLGLKFGASVQMYEIESQKFRLLHNRSKDATSNLLRFYLPELLPGVEKVLWVDSDGLVLGDVRTLVSTLFIGEHKNTPIAAVERPGKHLGSATGMNEADLSALGLSGVSTKDTVFNAGFIALNLNVWREQRLTLQIERLVDQLSSRGFQGFPGISTVDHDTSGAAHDSQTPLVLIFNNGDGLIQPMDSRWNVEGLGWKDVSRSQVCAGRYLHWSGKGKPWSPRHKTAAKYIEIWETYSALLGHCLTTAPPKDPNPLGNTLGPRTQQHQQRPVSQSQRKRTGRGRRAHDTPRPPLLVLH